VLGRINTGTATSRMSPRVNLLICICLVSVIGALYSRVIRYPFVNYDDPGYVVANEHVREGPSFHTVAWAVTAIDEANWHPVTWLSHAIDYELYGLNAGGHHLSNVLLHIANVLLLFWLLARATGSVWPSAFVAAMFGLHPMNVESVVWIAERKSVLSSFFFFLSLGAYGWYIANPHWKRYLALIVAFTFGLASKPMLVTFPFVLLLLDYWPLGPDRRSSPRPSSPPVKQPSWSVLVLEKIPLLVLSAVSIMVTIYAQRSGRAVESLGALPLRLRAANAVYSYTVYLGKLFRPINLAVVYPHPLDKLGIAPILLAVVLLVAVTAGASQSRSRRPYVLIGWSWFLGILVPVIGIIQVGAQGMADRYAYLPEIGIFVAVAWECAEWAKKGLANTRATGAIAIIILAAPFVASFRQIGYWRNSFDLWTHALAVTDDNFIADNALGNLLLKEGRPEALHYFEAAARIAPWDPISHGALAANFQDHGDFQSAIREYSIALQANPDTTFEAYAYTNLGVIYRQLGDYPLANENSQRALHIDSRTVMDLIEQMSRTVAVRPAAGGYLRLGYLFEGVGRISEARLAYDEALRLDPTFEAAQRALTFLDRESDGRMATSRPSQ
jgi:protein O-mannosyl-transferase